MISNSPMMMSVGVAAPSRGDMNEVGDGPFLSDGPPSRSNTEFFLPRSRPLPRLLALLHSHGLTGRRRRLALSSGQRARRACERAPTRRPFILAEFPLFLLFFYLKVARNHCNCSEIAGARNQAVNSIGKFGTILFEVVGDIRLCGLY